MALTEAFSSPELSWAALLWWDAGLATSVFDGMGASGFSAEVGERRENPEESGSASGRFSSEECNAALTSLGQSALSVPGIAVAPRVGGEIGSGDAPTGAGPAGRVDGSGNRSAGACSSGTARPAVISEKPVRSTYSAAKAGADIAAGVTSEPGGVPGERLLSGRSVPVVSGRVTSA